MNEAMIPIVLFLVTGACIMLPVYLRYLTRNKELDTLSKLAESSEEIRTDILKFMQHPTMSTPRNDLRKGLIFLAISIPVILGGLVHGEVMVSIVLGGIPLLVGLAYVYMAKSAEPTERDITN